MGCGGARSCNYIRSAASQGATNVELFTKKIAQPRENGVPLYDNGMKKQE